MNLRRLVRGWIRGNDGDHGVRFDVPYGGVVIHLAFGAGPPEPQGAFELVASDVGTPAQALELARFVFRQGLPVDAFVVSGLGVLGDGVWRSGRWLKAWVEHPKWPELIVLTDDLDPESCRRLKAAVGCDRR